MAEKGLIGVQMSTIAPNKMPRFDAYESMEKLTDIGYHCIEISQVPMTKENVAGFRRSIDELGMNVAACTALVAPMPQAPFMESLSDKYDKIVDDCKALDCDMLRIGAMPMEARFSYEASLDFAKKADEYACRLKEDGIDLYYHNHHFEFARFNGQFLLDIIRENTRRLGFELDIHWIHRGGEDPVAVIKKYAGSIRLLHLKDYRIGEMKAPEGGLDPTNRESMMKFMSGFKDTVQFAEVGEGSLPVKACMEAGLAGGAEYFLVEQDDCYGRDPFESLKISHDNLVKLGFGDWF